MKCFLFCSDLQLHFPVTICCHFFETTKTIAEKDVFKLFIRTSGGGSWVLSSLLLLTTVTLVASCFRLPRDKLFSPGWKVEIR